MGLVYSEIELINGDDLALHRRNIILNENEIKRTNVTAVLWTGSLMLRINEKHSGAIATARCRKKESKTSE